MSLHSLPSRKLLIALTVYITALIASNTLGIKLMPFLFGTQLSVGVFTFPIVFIMTDIIGEVYGKRMARRFVLMGLISLIMWLIVSGISLMAPWSEKGLWALESYNQIFGISARFVIASLTAFAIAEYQDVWAFFTFKKLWGKKNFWIRSNLSNVWSQLLDTIIFMTIAFAGVRPSSEIVSIIVPWWLFKVLMGAVYTPLSYYGVRLLKSEKHEN